MSITTNTPATTVQTPIQQCAGNIQLKYVVQQSQTPVSVGAATIAEQSFTVTGVQVGDQIVVTRATMTNAVAPVMARVTAANTVAVAFCNPTAGALVPTAEIYTYNVIRPMSQSLANGLPVSLLLS